MTDQPYNVLTTPVSEMPPGFFWTRCEVIGLTDDEARAMMRGEKLPDARQHELIRRMTIERQMLIMAQVGVVRC